MRGRVLLWVSLGLNVALAVLLARFSPEVTVRNATPAVTPQPLDATKTYKTNVVVRRQNFTWDEIESADFPTYIAKLRAIGCPEATIRDIILADVNKLYAPKLLALPFRECAARQRASGSARLPSNYPQASRITRR